MHRNYLVYSNCKSTISCKLWSCINYLSVSVHNLQSTDYNTIPVWMEHVPWLLLIFNSIVGREAREA
jgi:hypothetical protein